MIPMKLKKKVSQKATLAQVVAIREEEKFLRSIKSRIGSLQFAAGAAEGLASILTFLEGEDGREGWGQPVHFEQLSSGLYEIAAALHRCLLCETDAAEREVRDRQHLLDRIGDAPRKAAEKR
jgi:hypothetical protein